MLIVCTTYILETLIKDLEVFVCELFVYLYTSETIQLLNSEPSQSRESSLLGRRNGMVESSQLLVLQREG